MGEEGGWILWLPVVTFAVNLESSMVVEFNRVGEEGGMFLLSGWMFLTCFISGFNGVGF